jgi:hypothetical protein
VVLARGTGTNSRPERGPRPRHRPSLPEPADPRPRRPRPPGRRRHLPHPYHHHEQAKHYQQFNRDHARLRAPANAPSHS